MQYTFPASGGGEIRLTFDIETVEQFNPGHVLVFPFYQGKILMVQHQRRGWELPGGKVKYAEDPMAAAIRETYEESGAILKKLEWVGQYHIKSPRLELTKNIYYAEVYRLEALPKGFETRGIRLFSQPPTNVAGGEFSYILKDQTYELTLEYLRATKRNPS